LIQEETRNGVTARRAVIHPAFTLDVLVPAGHTSQKNKRVVHVAQSKRSVPYAQDYAEIGPLAVPLKNLLEECCLVA
jgi:hypothetical protein